MQRQEKAVSTMEAGAPAAACLVSWEGVWMAITKVYWGWMQNEPCRGDRSSAGRNREPPKGIANGSSAAKSGNFEQ